MLTLLFNQRAIVRGTGVFVGAMASAVALQAAGGVTGSSAGTGNLVGTVQAVAALSGVNVGSLQAVVMPQGKAAFPLGVAARTAVQGQLVGRGRLTGGQQGQQQTLATVLGRLAFPVAHRGAVTAAGTLVAHAAGAIADRSQTRLAGTLEAWGRLAGGWLGGNMATAQWSRGWRLDLTVGGGATVTPQLARQQVGASGLSTQTQTRVASPQVAPHAEKTFSTYENL